MGKQNYVNRTLILFENICIYFKLQAIGVAESLAKVKVKLPF